ncbi:metal-dependent hydrolase [compost metagenome]
MYIHQIRNATVLIQYAGKKFLIDPMLAAKGTYDAFRAGFNEEERNPIVELPMPVEQIVDNIDAVILTHLHLDHYDEAAKEALPKTIKIFVQNEKEAQQIRNDGFEQVEVLTADTVFEGIRLIKTQGEHGRGETLLSMMGEVCGVVFKHTDEKTLYLAGDTVWYEGVRQELESHTPDIVIVNGGNNSFEEHGSLIMCEEDIHEVHKAAPEAQLISVHMEAVNHWKLSKQELRRYSEEQGFSHRLLIPEDGESYVF